MTNTRFQMEIPFNRWGLPSKRIWEDMYIEVTGTEDQMNILSRELHSWMANSDRRNVTINCIDRNGNNYERWFLVGSLVRTININYEDYHRNPNNEQNIWVLGITLAYDHANLDYEQT
ncbi:MAG: hypothetical protein GTO02_20605 [Candidatus Dadabacteria bacterium]|nr:hypothetical protein [Candidatus Dadabacteria bacterium]